MICKVVIFKMEMLFSNFLGKNFLGVYWIIHWLIKKELLKAV